MKILLISSTNLFTVDSVPSDLRMSNLARFWVELGADVTYMRFCKKNVQQSEIQRMSGVKMSLCRVSELKWLIIMFLDRALARVLLQNIWQTVRNFYLWRFARCNIKKGSFDCVVTSLPGHGSLLLARKISKWLKIPLIADFRDLPDEFDPERKTVRMRIECRSVERALRDASLVTVVSPIWPEVLAKRFHYQDAKVAMNGYEGVLPESSCGRDEDGKMTIFYAGVLSYGRDQNFELLFKALDKLIDKGVDISPVVVKVAGLYRQEWFERLSKYKSSFTLKHIGMIPRKDAITNQQDASILLNISSPEAPGVIPSKIFEYVKARRPILNIPSKADVLAQFVLRSRTGECCETVEEISDYIEKNLREWQANGYLVEPDADMMYLRRFSRAFQAKKFYEHIKEVVGK